MYEGLSQSVLPLSRSSLSRPSSALLMAVVDLPLSAVGHVHGSFILVMMAIGHEGLQSHDSRNMGSAGIYRLHPPSFCRCPIPSNESRKSILCWITRHLETINSRLPQEADLGLVAGGRELQREGG